MDEIVFLQTATCVGAGFDCPNVLKVLAAIKPDDARFIPKKPGLPRFDDQRLADEHASGYSADAGEQIPGDVTRLWIARKHVHVEFDAKIDSDICKRALDRGSEPPCPAPGRYHWNYAWTPHKLTRVVAPAGTGGRRGVSGEEARRTCLVSNRAGAFAWNSGSPFRQPKVAGSPRLRGDDDIAI